MSANFKPKRTAAASRGFLATARLSCFNFYSGSRRGERIERRGHRGQRYRLIVQTSSIDSATAASEGPPGTCTQSAGRPDGSTTALSGRYFDDIISFFYSRRLAGRHSPTVNRTATAEAKGERAGTGWHAMRHQLRFLKAVVSIRRTWGRGM